VLHHLWTLVWQVWLTRNEDLHGRNDNEKEYKRLKNLRPPRIIALHAKQDLLLAYDKQIFELPIHDCMLLPHSREVKRTWERLVTPTVKGALPDAEQHLCDANCAILDFLVTARPDPLTTDELVNEQRPAPQMQQQIERTKKFLFFSSRFVFGSRQLCACRSHRSSLLSQVWVLRGGGGEAAK
jgi:hypothetical protein